MKRVLMIAYHFPPIQGSSGVHRTVQFARHLPSFGWTPLIVTVHPRAYPTVGDDSWAKLPEETIVERAFALDSARHLAVQGRYLGATAIPDRWVSWWPSGVAACLRLIKQYRPQVLWSTFPVATAHWIALTVHRLTGLPWVADFRDPMVQDGQPASGLQRKIYQRLERAVVRQAACCTLVSQSALEDYRTHYPDKNPASWQVIENGYDESLFAPYAHLSKRELERPVGQPVKLLHSGILYSAGRNPLPFLEAVKALVEKNRINVEVVFRGSGNEAEVGAQIARLGLAQVVKLQPSIAYDHAIREMLEADVLLVFQGAVFNSQIPAKLYEYLRAGRPILAMTDKSGETTKILRDWNGTYLADAGSKDSIERALLQLFLDQDNHKDLSRDLDAMQKLSRYGRTEQLNEVLRAIANT